MTSYPLPIACIGALRAVDPGALWTHFLAASLLSSVAYHRPLSPSQDFSIQLTGGRRCGVVGPATRSPPGTFDSCILHRQAKLVVVSMFFPWAFSSASAGALWPRCHFMTSTYSSLSLSQELCPQTLGALWTLRLYTWPLLSVQDGVLWSGFHAVSDLADIWKKQ